MSNHSFDLIIVGGGVSGTALAYLASRYSGLKKIGLIEKYAAPAQVNSHAKNNSQTLHAGDIETNYNLEKALKVQRAARMVENFAIAQPDHDHLIFNYSRMVLGVGTKEVEALEKRFEIFGPHYPDMQLLDKKGVAKLEPNVAMKKGRLRDDDILALASSDKNCAVDYEALAKAFVRQAQKQDGTEVSIIYNHRVRHIKYDGEFYSLETDGTCFRSRALVVSAGGHSLQLAQDFGHGLNYSCLPTAGSYYFTPHSLNGKVYTVQNDKLPFAAVHGDPDVLVPGKTRFGPTALLLPLLERYNYETLPEFLRIFQFDKNVAAVLMDLVKDPDIRNYMLKNMLYEIPFIRKPLFLKEVQKIVPDTRLRDLKFAAKIGGIRPQLIDKKNQKLMLGEAKIHTPEGALFNMTPSPGASSCLENAEIDLRIICQQLEVDIDEKLLADELLKDDSQHSEDDFTGRIIE